MILLQEDHTPCNMRRGDRAETKFRIRMYGHGTIETDRTAHPRLYQQCTVGKQIIISRDIQLPFFALHPVEDLIFCISSPRHDQRVLLDIFHCYSFFCGELMILPDEDAPCL